MNLPCDLQLLEQIRKHNYLSGVHLCNGFEFHLDFSVPIIATAIHAGHQVRDELLPYMALSSDQRLFEEDEGTELMIKGQPNRIWGLESRAVYDLNRYSDMALPLTAEKFWGTRVYQSTPPDDMNLRSLKNYHMFYHFIGTVITHMLDLFGYCIVYDIHSYNISRQKEKGFKSPPVFNLGTAALDRLKWKLEIETWLENLKRISLPGIETNVAENEVFSGKGAFCEQLIQWDEHILVLPTEVSKFYMNEFTGKVYPEIIHALQKGLDQAIANQP